MTDEFRRVTIAVAQSKSVYERVQAVQSLLADARRAENERCARWLDTHACEEEAAQVRALLDDAGRAT